MTSMKNIKALEELFNSMSDLSPEKMENIVQEFTKVFEELVAKMTSSDEKERKDAMDSAHQLKEILEKQAEAACAATGMDAEALDGYIQNPDNFTETEWQSLQQASKELQSYQKDLAAKGILGTAAKQGHVKKKPKKEAWLSS